MHYVCIPKRKSKEKVAESTVSIKNPLNEVFKKEEDKLEVGEFMINYNHKIFKAELLV